MRCGSLHWLVDTLLGWETPITDDVLASGMAQYEGTKSILDLTNNAISVACDAVETAGNCIPLVNYAFFLLNKVRTMYGQERYAQAILEALQVFGDKATFCEQILRALDSRDADNRQVAREFENILRVLMRVEKLLFTKSGQNLIRRTGNCCIACCFSSLVQHRLEKASKQIIASLAILTKSLGEHVIFFREALQKSKEALAEALQTKQELVEKLIKKEIVQQLVKNAKQEGQNFDIPHIREKNPHSQETDDRKKHHKMVRHPSSLPASSKAVNLDISLEKANMVSGITSIVAFKPHKRTINRRHLLQDGIVRQYPYMSKIHGMDMESMSTTKIMTHGIGADRMSTHGTVILPAGRRRERGHHAGTRHTVVHIIDPLERVYYPLERKNPFERTKERNVFVVYSLKKSPRESLFHRTLIPNRTAYVLAVLNQVKVFGTIAAYLSKMFFLQRKLAFAIRNNSPNMLNAFFLA